MFLADKEKGFGLASWVLAFFGKWALNLISELVCPWEVGID